MWEREEDRRRKVWLVAHSVGSRAVHLRSWGGGEAMPW